MRSGLPDLLLTQDNDCHVPQPGCWAPQIAEAHLQLPSGPQGVPSCLTCQRMDARGLQGHQLLHRASCVDSPRMAKSCPGSAACASFADGCLAPAGRTLSSCQYGARSFAPPNACPSSPSRAVLAALSVHVTLLAELEVAPQRTIGVDLEASCPDVGMGHHLVPCYYAPEVVRAPAPASPGSAARSCSRSPQ